MIAPAPSDVVHDNRGTTASILGLAVVSAVAYGFLAFAGDLGKSPAVVLVVHLGLSGAMLVAWGTVRRDRRALRWALIAALGFRLVAVAGPPLLSDDVYRYVWDGRVQAHGFHPYAHSPLDPRLEDLRDEHWSQINHAELKTIYPPAAQLFFLVLGFAGAGPVGFKLAFGVLDFGVVLALVALLRALDQPVHRVVLYAWNPLAVLETAGSAHVEPLGVLLAVVAAAWIIDRRPTLSTLALGAAIQVKILPVLLVPGFLRRAGWRQAAILLLVTLALALPYALTGPAVGAGLFDYAERWERNSVIFPVVRGIIEMMDPAPFLKQGIGRLQEAFPGRDAVWAFLYRHVGPGSLARLVMGVAACAWVGYVVRRRYDAARESLLVLGGVLLLSPTLHPWYLLWVLPFAVACMAPGWLVLAATIPLSYAFPGEVPWSVRVVEYLPAVAAACWFRYRVSSDDDGTR